MRICRSCKMEKEMSDFSVRKGSKDGLNRKCKKCVRDTKRKWELNNPEKVIRSRENRKESLKEHRKKLA